MTPQSAALLTTLVFMLTFLRMFRVFCPPAGHSFGTAA